MPDAENTGSYLYSQIDNVRNAFHNPKICAGRKFETHFVSYAGVA